MKPVNFDGFINYYRLNASESRDNKIIFYLFLFFFSMKVRHVHCVWSQFLYSPSLHDLQNIKCHFVNGQLAVCWFFVRSQLRSDLASEKFKHLRDFLETSNFLIYRWTLNIGNLDQMHLLMMRDTKRWITWRCKVWKKWDDISE